MKTSVILLTVLCLAFIVSVRSNIMITLPQSLNRSLTEKYKDKGGRIPYSIANYVEVPYGKMISGFIATSEVLEDCVYDEIDTNTALTGMIILAERNDCTFTQKSLVAQKEGAHLAIIMDSIDENPERIIMADDGRGQLVHIPTILINKEDG